MWSVFQVANVAFLLYTKTDVDTDHKHTLFGDVDECECVNARERVYDMEVAWC